MIAEVLAMDRVWGRELMARHLLVTNDFPPKIGGIQNYLFELWRRLDPQTFTVVTSYQPGCEEFDARLNFEVIRLRQKILLPTRSLRIEIQRICELRQASLIIWDPAFPLGLLARKLGTPYGVVVHGAELTIPARLPVVSRLVGRTLAKAAFLISAGQYPKSELERLFDKDGIRSPEIFEIPPGVDTARFAPVAPSTRLEYRSRLGVDDGDFLVTSVSRLVPRKGMDTLIEASGLIAKAHSNLKVRIAGSGRDSKRLERLIRKHGAPVELVGRVSDDELPLFIGSGDAFAMLCRNRWGGLEQEGFGIVFLEAGSCSVPVIAGYSGGSCEAVTHEQSGYVVYKPRSARKSAEALSMLVSNPALAMRMGVNGRQRAISEFSYDVLGEKLAKLLSSLD